MCGIVGAIAARNVVPILMEGLRRLEYRGYDSAGVATVNADGEIRCVKTVGRIDSLAAELPNHVVDGNLGIGHTRWATHGRPTEENAHPHFGGNGVLALAHNGVIENYQTLREEMDRELEDIGDQLAGSVIGDGPSTTRVVDLDPAS